MGKKTKHNAPPPAPAPQVQRACDELIAAAQYVRSGRGDPMVVIQLAHDLMRTSVSHSAYQMHDTDEARA